MVETRHEILGVFPDQVTADDVVRRLRALAAGSPGVSGGIVVRVDDPDVTVAAMKAEMRDEADNTIVGPGNFGPFTEEMTKSLVVWVTVGALVGGLLLLPLGLIEMLGLPLATRMVIAAIMGVVTGATVGFVAGGGLATSGGYAPMAAEEGVTVAVDVPASLATDVVRVMRSANPIRLDLGSLDGAPVDTLVTDDRGNPALDVARKVRAGADQTGVDGN